jgi:hypothetical protein
MTIITSAAIKDQSDTALRQRKERQEALFFVEGIPWARPFRQGASELSCLCARTLESAFAASWCCTGRRRRQLPEISAEVFASIADKENQLGILAVVHNADATAVMTPEIFWGVALMTPQDLAI